MSWDHLFTSLSLLLDRGDRGAHLTPQPLRVILGGGEKSNQIICLEGATWDIFCAQEETS